MLNGMANGFYYVDSTRQHNLLQFIKAVPSRCYNKKKIVLRMLHLVITS